MASNSSGNLSNDERQRLLPPLAPSRTTSYSKRPVRPPMASPIIKLEELEEDKESGNLVIYFLLMLVFALGNRVFGRLETYPLHNYPIFLSMVLCLVYVPVCFAYIIPAMMFTNNITEEQVQIPKYKFAVMGAYDSLAGLLSTFAVNYIASASTVVLVQQSAIPISMLVSFLTLGSRYTNAQYLGASIVMGGIVLVLIPSFMGGAQTDASGAAVDPMGQLLWIGVLVISCVPMCLSSVYKEKALGEVEIDCTYLNGWVAIFQLLIGIPLCIPSSLVQGMPVSNILPNIYQGFLCWGGINSVTEENNPYNQPLDNCAAGPLMVTTFLFFNVIYNFLIVVILKYGSANILWLASTMIVPLSNVVFSLKFIPGSKPMGPMDLVGLVVIMLGLVVYRFSSQVIELYEYLTGKSLDPEEIKKRLMLRKLALSVERKQINYVGLNQLESLQGVVDTRVARAELLSLFRSPKIIRDNYLLKLGVQPSPRFSVSSSGRDRDMEGGVARANSIDERWKERGGRARSNSDLRQPSFLEEGSL
ncbi:hypothetical protein B484DRAFT_447043 [Ochromonadaceae sp. CCMP2298]|nr:hypothetical protein B484DRAFT_447043 [Ochromonadaceae sp. CCMP2298]|mmetsp:Transcript_4060/g.9116  ORF Transcript_4060/g.9116 Transcript_4060/m.9116 type:complete len:532 (+) Transcript_4060:26-1621(+)